MQRQPDPQHPPHFGSIFALAAGAATFCLLAAVLLATASWYREHLWLPWDPWGLRYFYAASVLLAFVPGLLVWLLVDRQIRLRQALRHRDLEVATVRAELGRTNQALMALGAVNHELVRARDEKNFLASVCRAVS